MKHNLLQIRRLSLAAAGAIALLTACNKTLPEPTPILPPVTTGQTLGAIVGSDPSFSFLQAAITRAGTSAPFNLADTNSLFTLFAPDNSAFAASGITSIGQINALPVATAAAIVSYHVLPGQKIQSTAISTNFPNNYYPSAMTLAAPSAAIPFGVRNQIFPSARSNGAWVNQIPIKATDQQGKNGVMHTMAAILMPPSTTLRTTMRADSANYSLLLAAIARADSGIAAPSRFDSLLNLAVANFTLFAPTNDAFRALFPPGTPDLAIIGALNTPALFTATQVRGIIAYHLIGARAFSVNIPATPTPVGTLLVIPGFPSGLPVVATNTAGAVTIKGVANATPAAVTSANINNINGVIHRVNQVLRPQ